MAAKSPVVLILGAGPNVGQAVARTFASKGYKVGLAARSLKAADSTDNQLNIPSDFAKTDDVVNAFAKVKEVFGIPSVVVYNGMPSSPTLPSPTDRRVAVSAVSLTPSDNPFALSMADLSRDTTINIYSAFVAAQQAVSGFAQLPASVARTFIYTGNVLNVSILPRFLSQGIGKSGAAHMIWAAADAFKDRGYK
jgi:NAD(P)-dependent dehydrogenase (short-subunit alcohol dehydrogenase family)